MSIRLLPPDCRKNIKSSNDIPTFWKCVEEVLLNSLDAGSTCIAVRVDTKQASKIQVIDNGSGIQPTDMFLLGERYATSKTVQDSTFGFRGVALASIGHIAGSVSVESRSAKGGSFKKVFRNGTLSKAASVAERKCVGTTVTIEDLFRRFPVRKKGLNPELTLEWLVDRITVLSIMFHEVSISLRDESSGKIFVRTQPTESPKKTFRAIFGHFYPHSIAAVPEIQRTFKTEALGVDTPSRPGISFSVRSWAGKKPHFNDTLRLVGVNRRPIFGSDIHKFVDKLFRKTTILKRKTTKAPPNKKSKPEWPDSEDLVSVYPVYILDIRCAKSQVEIIDQGSWTEVHFSDWNALRNTLTEFFDDWFRREDILIEADNEKTGEKRGSESKTVKWLDQKEPKEYGKSISASRCAHSKFSQSVTAETEYFENVAQDKTEAGEECGDLENIGNTIGGSAKKPNLGKVAELKKDWTVKNRWIKSYPLFTSLAPEKSLTKVSSNQLRNSTVIGQFANSFIVLKMSRSDSESEHDHSPLLVVLDQHAADERIRLEQIQAASSEKLTLTEKLQVFVSEGEIRVLLKYGHKLEYFGLKASFVKKNSYVEVLEIPKCLADKAKNKESNLRRDIRDILTEFVQDIKRTEGALGTVPKTLMDIWKMQACRSAVMFGRKLDMEEMTRIVREVAECKLPFQCAHGRPTVVPIFDMNNLIQ